MNKKNINKSNATKILSWCKKTYGKSQFKKTYPKLCFYKIKSIDNNCAEYVHADNTIYVYQLMHDSFISFIDTIIHEYTHFLQDEKMYEKYSKKYKKSYNHHPYELRAEEIAMRDKRKCLQEIFLNKK